MNHLYRQLWSVYIIQTHQHLYIYYLLYIISNARSRRLEGTEDVPVLFNLPGALKNISDFLDTQCVPLVDYEHMFIEIIL